MRPRPCEFLASGRRCAEAPAVLTCRLSWPEEVAQPSACVLGSAAVRTVLSAT